VQAEIWRLERANLKAMREGSDAARFRQQFQQTIAPYEAILRAEGGDPIKTYGNYLQAVQTLRTGSPTERASSIAQFCKLFGVDVGLLDQALAAQGFASPQQQIQGAPIPQQYRDPRVDDLFAAIEQQQQQSDQQLRGEVADEMASFAADPKHEFLNDVREDMADLLEVTARRGRVMSLQEAYERACRGNESVGKVLAQRELEKAAQTQRQSAARARGASLSVTGTPTVPDGVSPTDGSRRADIEAAISQLSGR
jgi:hypothetical protein